MAFCKYCGAEISQDSVFCYKCGKEIGKTIDDKHIAHIHKKDTVEEINYWYKIFNDKYLTYDLRDQSRLNEIKLKEMSVFWLFVVFIAIAFFLSAIIYNALPYFIGFPVSMVVLSVVSIVPPFIISVKREKGIKLYHSFVIEANEKLLKFYNSLDQVPFGFEYSNPRIIDRLRKIISDGRADTIKEALNCLIEDNHKEQMLINQKQMKQSADTAALFAIGSFINTRK